MFILAHLSDPHLAPLPPASLAELANKRITGYFNWHRKRKHITDMAVLGRIVAHMKASPCDHIAATGDFANISLPDEYIHARDWLSGLGSPDDVTAIPGNHDVYVPGGLELMQSACAANMQGDDGSMIFPFVRRRGQVAIIATNTGVPMPPFVGAGKLGKDQLRRLAALLAALDRENLFRVVLIHHPPASERDWSKRLFDAAALLKVVATHGAELVIHGHDHIHELHWLVGPHGRVPAVGVPSASSAPGKGKANAAYNVYRIDGGPNAWRCEMESRGIGGDNRVATINRMMLTT